MNSLGSRSAAVRRHVDTHGCAYWNEQSTSIIHIRTGAISDVHARYLNRNLDLLIPLKLFVRLHGKAFYQYMELFYPQAWAFVYFLKNSESAPLHIYEKLINGARNGVGAKECVDSAFEGADFQEMDKRFKEFVKELSG